MDHDATELATAAAAANDDDAVSIEPTDTAVDELLIEEISIDGMCGVY